MKPMTINLDQISAYGSACFHARDRLSTTLRAVVVGAALSGVFLISTSSLALAQQTLADYSREVSTKTNVIVDIVAYVSYIAGATLSALGITDLKKHVENPSQTPMKIGLSKLGFGGVLLGLPFLSGVMAETMTGESQATYQGFERGSIQIN